MKINKDNRTLVNIFGAPFIIFSIMYNNYSFYFLIFSIILFSFYEYITLIITKSKITFSSLIFGFFWISSIGLFIPLYNSESIPNIFILLIFFSVWITDSAAFVMGKKFGKSKIFPSVSANKTWVGSISGLLFSAIFLLVIYFSFDRTFFWPKKFQLINAISVGLITGLFSQAGDFLESYFKRKLGVKDSSNLLLGHGGFLDRFDSMFAVSFGTYLYLLLTSYYV
tara:strand:- start:355 stop:1029 length:675 start_codon:yes stop_codon:yes gene_type:complete